MSADDWKAFRLAYELLCEISRVGRSALLPFAQAIVECEGQQKTLAPVQQNKLARTEQS